MIQLNLFQKYSETELLEMELDRVKDSSDKVRKGTYARLNEIGKMCVELQNRLDIIERYICKRSS